MEKANIEKLKNELLNQKGELLLSFDEYIGKLTVTDDEIKEERKRLKEKGLDAKETKEHIDKYSIKKKLNLIIQEKQRHKTIDEAVKFLDELLESYSTE